MEEVIIEDDDDQTTHKHEMPARNSTHGAGSSTNCALTTEPLSCPFCPFIVECYDQVSVMQEHVENVHLSFTEEVNTFSSPCLPNNIFR